MRDTDLENWIFKGGIKTESGIQRSVPIHRKIRELVVRRYEEAKKLNSEYLFNCTDSTADIFLSYNKYKHRFLKVVKKLSLNVNHKPHDGRVQFVTMAKKYNVDEYAIKYMVGHIITDITESVYTDRDISWLQTETEKIK